jgi:hypothetical protein
MVLAFTNSSEANTSLRHSRVVESWRRAEIPAPTNCYKRGHWTRVAATIGRTLTDSQHVKCDIFGQLRKGGRRPQRKQTITIHKRKTVIDCPQVGNMRGKAAGKAAVITAVTARKSLPRVLRSGLSIESVVVIPRKVRFDTPELEVQLRMTLKRLTLKWSRLKNLNLDRHLRSCVGLVHSTVVSML